MIVSPPPYSGSTEYIVSKTILCTPSCNDWWFDGYLISEIVIIFCNMYSLYRFLFPLLPAVLNTPLLRRFSVRQVVSDGRWSSRIISEIFIVSSAFEGR